MNILVFTSYIWDLNSALKILQRRDHLASIALSENNLKDLLSCEFDAALIDLSKINAKSAREIASTAIKGNVRKIAIIDPRTRKERIIQGPSKRIAYFKYPDLMYASPQGNLLSQKFLYSEVGRYHFPPGNQTGFCRGVKILGIDWEKILESLL